MKHIKVLGLIGDCDGDLEATLAPAAPDEPAVPDKPGAPTTFFEMAVEG